LIPTDQPERLAKLLGRLGAAVTTNIAPGAGHGLDQQDLEVLRSWI
jgi:predicted esterase